MTTDSQLNFHRQLLTGLKGYIVQQPPFNAEQLLEDDVEFVALFSRLCENPNAAYDGQQLISTIITRYPHITPMVPRDLFWYFGGDCLHFLGDEEIEFFQQLDEAYHQLLSENPAGIDYAKLRAGAGGEQPRHLN